MSNIEDLIRGLTLVYRESEIEDMTDATKETITELCNTIRLPPSVDLDRTREVMNNLKKLLMRFVTDGYSKGDFDRDLYIQDVRLSCKGREDALDSFTKGIEPIEEEDRLKKIRNRLRKDLANTMKVVGIRKDLSDALRTVKQTPDHKLVDILQDMQARLDTMVTSVSRDVEAKRGSQSVLLSDMAKLETMFELSKSDDNPKLYLNVGWQWLKEMLGRPARMRRGDMVGVYALQHRFKSGFASAMARQIPEHNPDFVTLDETKKPLLIYMSTENHLQENVKKLFVDIKQNETGKKVNENDFTVKEMAEYVNKWKEEKGWEIAMVREDPSDFTYRDMIAMVESYEAKGYEVVTVICDYLAMCSTKGCYTSIGGGTGMDVRALFRRVRNYMASKSILFITPHQLSTTAKGKLTEYGDAKFLENIVDKGMFDSCGTIDQEFDLEIYLHIAKSGGAKYLCSHRGKHRSVDDTPEIHMQKVIPFCEIGIPDDLGASRAIPKVPGASAGLEDW